MAGPRHITRFESVDGVTVATIPDARGEHEATLDLRNALATAVGMDYAVDLHGSGKAPLGVGQERVRALMTGDDERLLAEIEKLIKRKLPVESLDLGPAEARPRGERREAPDARRERAAGAPKRRRPEGESRVPRASGYSTDPFFSQPYEPSQAEPAEAAAQAGAAPEVPARGSVTGPRKSARPLAALLGGGRKG